MAGQFGEARQVFVPVPMANSIVRQSGTFRKAAELEMFIVKEMKC